MANGRKNSRQKETWIDIKTPTLLADKSQCCLLSINLLQAANLGIFIQLPSNWYFMLIIQKDKVAMFLQEANGEAGNFIQLTLNWDFQGEKYFSLFQ